ncbi:hypothetical protein VTL71DRAFT_10869 [Oculimacula yallundae]|uniref:Uncharacterized protein n=1 Tax=Oculimacula yallundae TaxID=86028 RepID=A0ABR4CUU3_9HELO
MWIMQRDKVRNCRNCILHERTKSISAFFVIMQRLLPTFANKPDVYKCSPMKYRGFLRLWNHQGHLLQEADKSLRHSTFYVAHNGALA